MESFINVMIVLISFAGAALVSNTIVDTLPINKNKDEDFRTKWGLILMGLAFAGALIVVGLYFDKDIMFAIIAGILGGFIFSIGTKPSEGAEGRIRFRRKRSNPVFLALIGTMIYEGTLIIVYGFGNFTGLLMPIVVSMAMLSFITMIKSPPSSKKFLAFVLLLALSVTGLTLDTYNAFFA